MSVAQRSGLESAMGCRVTKDKVIRWRCSKARVPRLCSKNKVASETPGCVPCVRCSCSKRAQASPEKATGSNCSACAHGSRGAEAGQFMGAAVTALCMQHFPWPPSKIKCSCQTGSLMTLQLCKKGGTDYHSDQSFTTAVGYDD